MPSHQFWPKKLIRDVVNIDDRHHKLAVESANGNTLLVKKCRTCLKTRTILDVFVFGISPRGATAVTVAEVHSVIRVP